MYFHNCGMLEQVHFGHGLKITSAPCNKRLTLCWLGAEMTRSNFCPSSSYTVPQLEQSALKATEVTFLIIVLMMLYFFKPFKKLQ